MIMCEDLYPEVLNKLAKEMINDNFVELVFVDSNEMKEINLSKRHIDKTTDVLSFPYKKIPSKTQTGMPLGSVVINKDLAEQKALEFNHSKDDEIALLFIHGVLHILGFDHERDSGEMRKKEKELIEKFNLPKSLILRNE